VWSEKPKANTYKEGKALLDYARSKKLRIWGRPCGCKQSIIAFMSKAIQEGKLGKVSGAHANYGHTHGVDMVTHDHEAPQRFVPGPGNYVWQQGCHGNF
jgi:predicted dehydrogenase